MKFFFVKVVLMYMVVMCWDICFGGCWREDGWEEGDCLISLVWIIWLFRLIKFWSWVYDLGFCLRILLMMEIGFECICRIIGVKGLFCLRIRWYLFRVWVVWRRVLIFWVRGWDLGRVEGKVLILREDY